MHMCHFRFSSLVPSVVFAVDHNDQNNGAQNDNQNDADDGAWFRCIATTDSFGGLVFVRHSGHGGGFVAFAT